MTNDRDRPEPPADLDDDAREALATLEDLNADQLRAIGRYLETLAAWSDSSTDGDAGDDSDTGDGPDADPDFPEGVPEAADVTVKEIAGTTYYYYQWREGDRIESKTVQRE
ncbi:hypothetical protein [Haloterrigena alkaliphila]|uniref:hypothetical protein n=1 Tax=Haloterrigena alkaliphila TaxID=2816475 RepID=UPI001CFF5513|nr:hypothetical protein [Haloterrigena alkaliphila]UHQ95424.1 hypothetical protein J0X25_20630 [Haloterrigena alkaliphila]